MRFAISAVAALLFAVPASADVFARDEALRSAGAGTLERLTLDATLGRPNAERRLLRWLREEHNSAHQRDAWQAICGIRFRQQRYDEAVDACSEANAADVLNVVRVARNERPVEWRGAARVPLTDGRITVSAGGERTEAVFDTGAELTVVMASVARRMGARPLHGDVSVGTTTEDVQGGLVMLDRVQIGEGEARNVLALVLPDEQLTFGDFRLPMILGLPVMVASGRVGLLDHGRTVTFGTATPPLRGATTPLYWDEGGVGLALDFAKGRRGGHLDTGADDTYLFPAAVEVLSEGERETRTEVERRYAGVGGERVETWSRFEAVTMRVAGRTWRLDDVDMAANDVNGESARIGITLLQRFESVILDFRRMRAGVSP